MGNSLSTRFEVPAVLHDVLGNSQSVGELTAISLFTAWGTYFIRNSSTDLSNLRGWKAWAAVVVIADLFAGCVGNYSKGTNDHYHRDGTNTMRYVFYSIHFHIVALAYVANVSLSESLKVWAYTVSSGLLVNSLRGTDLQPIAAGSLMGVGLLAIPEMETPRWFQSMSLVYLMKVALSFSLDYHRQ